MRAEYWAVLTALCWAVGAFFEKKGLRLGGISPLLGAAVRTAVSMAVLAALSYPFWGQLRTAGARPLLMIAVAGGVFAGALGIACLYQAIGTGKLSTVLPIAFCLTPVVGAVLGMLFMSEKPSAAQLAGILLVLAGAFLVVYCQPASSSPR